MAALEIFHVAFLVASLEKAIPRFEELLGVNFREPQRLPILYRQSMHHPEPHEYTSYLTYSLEGPPYIELVEADDSDYKGLHQGERVHHIGVWAPDAGDLMESLVDRKLVRSEVVMKSTDGAKVRAWFSDPTSFFGARFEFVDPEWRDSFEKWVSDPNSTLDVYSEPSNDD